MEGDVPGGGGSRTVISGLWGGSPAAFPVAFPRRSPPVVRSCRFPASRIRRGAQIDLAVVPVRLLSVVSLGGKEMEKFLR